jgi:hypothetical protein
MRVAFCRSVPKQHAHCSVSSSLSLSFFAAASVIFVLVVALLFLSAATVLLLFADSCDPVTLPSRSLASSCLCLLFWFLFRAFAGMFAFVAYPLRLLVPLEIFLRALTAL